MADHQHSKPSTPVLGRMGHRGVLFRFLRTRRIIQRGGFRHPWIFLLHSCFSSFLAYFARIHTTTHEHQLPSTSNTNTTLDNNININTIHRFFSAFRFVSTRLDSSAFSSHRIRHSHLLPCRLLLSGFGQSTCDFRRSTFDAMRTSALEHCALLCCACMGHGWLG